MPVRLPVAPLALAAVQLVALGAGAAPCNRPDLVHAWPPDGAEGVPTDATLFAKYASTAEYLGEDVLLRHAGLERPLTASFDRVEGMLSVLPPDGLEPGGEYELEWPELRGLGTASLGRGRSVAFRVGPGPDVEAPRFGGVVGIEWDLDRERDACTDRLEERYVFELDLGEASDDGGRESLALVVFQTRGPSVRPEAPQPIAVTSLPRQGEPVRVARAVDDAVGEVCFAAVVRDLSGKVSGGGHREVCVEAERPPFFEGCALAPAGRAPGLGWTLALALGGALRRRRRGG
jgi:hypothetical protein